MLEQGGRYYDVKVHPYMDKDDVEVTLASCEWFYNHSTNRKFKGLIIELIASWFGGYLLGEGDAKDWLNAYKASRSDTGGEFLVSLGFYRKILPTIIGLEPRDYDVINEEVTNLSNELYTRVRYGGTYDSIGENCVYFRISSKNYDWYDDIWICANSLFGKKLWMDITVVRDKYFSEGKTVYLKGPRGIPLKNYSLEEFIAGKGCILEEQESFHLI